MQMQDITILEPIVFEDQSMRRTANGRVSAFDLISVVGGQKNPKDVWKSLCRDFPEVVGFSDYFKFEGRGQRETPVLGKEGALYVIGLLPGRAGKKYREEAAKLVLAWYEAPASLAIAAIDRIDNGKDSKEVLEKAAEKYLTAYHPLFEALKDCGADTFTYSNVNTCNTKAILGATPKEVVAARGGKNARSHLSAAEYGHFSTLQDCQLANIKKTKASDKKEAYAASKEVATEFEIFLNRWH
jgi:hypothetical protein